MICIQCTLHIMFVQHMYWPDELEWLLDFSSAKQKVHSIICNISWSSGRSVQQPLWGTLQCPAWTCTHTSDGKWICTFSAWTKGRKFRSPNKIFSCLLLKCEQTTAYMLHYWPCLSTYHMQIHDYDILWRIELTISFVTGVPSLLLVLWLFFFVALDSDNSSKCCF